MVLLVDDPPEPALRGTAPPARARARALPAEIERLLSEPRARFEQALERVSARRGLDRVEPTAEHEVRGVAADYEYAAHLAAIAVERYQPSDHNERFFATHVLGQLASDLALTASALRAAADDDPAKLTIDRLAQLHSGWPGPSVPRSRASSASATRRCRPRPTRR